MEEEANLVNSRRNFVRKNQKAGLQDSDSSRLSRLNKDGEYLSEVYGFVGYISIVVSTVILLIWAHVPDEFLESIGIYYYPSKYWALALPMYLMVTVFLALGFYIGLNFISTSTPTSLNTLIDEYSREDDVNFVPLMENEEDKPIDPISDIDITRINDLMFNSSYAN